MKQKYDIGIAADHGGYELKVQITAALKSAGYEVVDFGAHELVTGDDYPDFVIPMETLQDMRCPWNWYLRF